MRRWLALVIVGALLVALSPRTVVAEVSVDEHAGKGSRGLAFIGGGGEDPDPFPWGWRQVRFGAPPETILNPSGDLNGDGPPDFAIDPVSIRPYLTWAWFDGEDHEIVFTHWTGDGWSPWVRLTNNDDEDLDPSISFDEEGHMRIAWWRSEPEEDEYKVRFREQRSGDPGDPSSWAKEEKVSPPNLEAHRPSLARHRRNDWVAYLVSHPPESQTEIVVARKWEGSWVGEVVREVDYVGPYGTGDVDARLHTREGVLWIDWVEAPGLMGFRVYDEIFGWLPAVFEPYSWDAPADEPLAREEARVRIRLLIFKHLKRF